jgi:hypothetical protein
MTDQDIKDLSVALDNASRLMRLFSIDAETLREKTILNHHIMDINRIRNTVRMNYFWSKGESVAFPESEKAYYPDGEEMKKPEKPIA